MNEKLHEIEIENLIIIIYFILLTIYLYANSVEIEYLKYQNALDKEKYRLLLYIVFGTTFLITSYYTIVGIESLNEIDNKEIYILKKLSTFANVLILISTIIYLYIIYKDKDINLEVSP